MDILAPTTTAARRVLVLGARPSDLEELTRRFATIELCVDLAQTHTDALQCFLDQGGHDAVFLIGAETEEKRRTLLALCEVDPGLALGQSGGLPAQKDLQALAGELRR